MVEWMLPFLAALGTGVLSSWGVGGGALLLLGVPPEELEAALGGKGPAA